MLNSFLKAAGHVYKLLICVILFSGCSVFRPNHKDENGYYTEHFNSCGPVALEKAIGQHYINQGIVWVTWPAPREEISKTIQDNSTMLDGRKCLTFLHRDFVNITWPHEMKEICNRYNLKLMLVKSLDDLTDEDVGIVLVHKTWSVQYHWMSWPYSTKEEIRDFYPSRTDIISVYALRPIFDICVGGDTPSQTD
jgi:hypothetical protein